MDWDGGAWGWGSRWWLGVGLGFGGGGVGSAAVGVGDGGFGGVGWWLGAVGFGGGGTEILGICLTKWLIHMVKISSKSKVFEFSGGQKPPIRGLTIIKTS